MIYLIYGASGSGKSAFAEKVLEGLPGEKKYYIATMMANENDADFCQWTRIAVQPRKA